MTAIEEYLETDYSPDGEFVDGRVVERHLGEKPHSSALGNAFATTGEPLVELPLADVFLDL